MKSNDTYIETWSTYNALALAIVTPIALLYQWLDLLLYVFSISLICLIYGNRHFLLKSKPVFGVANSISLIRFLIILFSFLTIDFTNTTALCLALSIAVALDFFDGKAARYFKESSFFGQYFDMEIDAFFVLLMCSFFYVYASIPIWIMIPGLLRYLFRLYTIVIPRKNHRETKKNYGTLIAASFFVILLIGLVTKGKTQLYFLLVGSIAIMTSFLIGIIQYHQK